VHLLDGDEELSPEEEMQIRKILSFCVVGGGPTGVEFTGELSDFLRGDMARMYPHLSAFWTVHLIDAVDKLLGPFQDPHISQYALEHLTREGKPGTGKCMVHLGQGVDKIEDGLISLKDGKAFDFSTLVWCAGIKPLPFVDTISLTKDAKNRQLLTTRQLQVKGEQDIF